MKYNDKTDIILESIIILETLSTEDRKEIGYQLKIKIPWLLSKSIEERKQFSHIIKRLYNTRSEIVYNGGKNVLKLAKKLENLDRAAFYAQEIVRLVVLRLLVLKNNKLEFLAHKELTKKLEDLMLGINLDLTNSVYFDEIALSAVKNMLEIYEKNN